jgi:hypothetical protein
MFALGYHTGSERLLYAARSVASRGAHDSHAAGSIPFIKYPVTGSFIRIAACRGSPRDRPLTLCGRRQAKKNPSTIGEVFNAVSEGTTPIFSYAA